jgi:hypothetical protein
MPMPKDSGTASREGTQFRKDQAIVPLIQPWQPSQLKIGLGTGASVRESPSFFGRVLDGLKTLTAT